MAVKYHPASLRTWKRLRRGARHGMAFYMDVPESGFELPISSSDIMTLPLERVIAKYIRKAGNKGLLPPIDLVDPSHVQWVDDVYFNKLNGLLDVYKRYKTLFAFTFDDFITMCSEIERRRLTFSYVRARVGNITLRLYNGAYREALLAYLVRHWMRTSPDLMATCGAVKQDSDGIWRPCALFFGHKVTYLEMNTG